MMNDLIAQFTEISNDIGRILVGIGADGIKAEIAEINSRIQSSDFWTDSETAQNETIKLARLKEKIQPWDDLKDQVDEAIILGATNDDSLRKELGNILNDSLGRLAILKNELKFSGLYDEYDAIVSIYSGAGGTDAQDWAGMLERMYLRWAENNHFKSKIIDRNVGSEAGIKSVTFEINGRLVYGKLRGEQGVHRLVRLSPYNADHLRQTSFAKVEILPKVDKPDEVEIDQADLRIDVYRAGGHGGQSVNTTDSAVRITHVPTGIAVAIQNERSQLQNKETAMTIIRSRLAQLQVEQHKDVIKELKGPNEQAAWGNQIRSYVLHPYNLVKDLRTNYETSNTQAVLGGDINEFIDAYLDWSVNTNSQ
jgi:peptide chain release factor 2